MPALSALAAPVAAPALLRPAALAAGLLLAQSAAMWGAFFVLAPAIDWPASLDQPAAAILPLIRAQSAAVAAGYGLYLAHALLLIPLAVLLRETLRMSPLLGATALTLGVLAGLFKALGISRWLFLMPGLASAHADPGATDATRAAIAVAYDAFNAYAGGIGEVLGVALFAGTWTVLLSLALVRGGGAARGIGLAGFAAAALLLATLPSAFGLEMPALLTMSGIAWQVWAAVLAAWHLRARA